jgi:hypothetical protein
MLPKEIFEFLKLHEIGNTKFMERLSTNAVQVDQSITWKKLTAKVTWTVARTL